jgi:hypothetical protein
MSAAGRIFGRFSLWLPHTVRGLSMTQARDASWLVGSSALENAGSMLVEYVHAGGVYCSAGCMCRQSRCMVGLSMGGVCSDSISTMLVRSRGVSSGGFMSHGSRGGAAMMVIGGAVMMVVHLICRLWFRVRSDSVVSGWLVMCTSRRVLLCWLCLPNARIICADTWAGARCAQWKPLAR